MTREELKEILPHREPMLLLDEATKIEDNLAEGKYTVRGDEWFLQGHFPGNPVVPGVIQCEMMAQTCCVLLVEEVKAPVCVAGSVDSYEKLDQMKAIAPWAFTIGSAFFDKKFGDDFRGQIDRVCRYIRT